MSEGQAGIFMHVFIFFYIERNKADDNDDDDDDSEGQDFKIF